MKGANYTVSEEAGVPVMGISEIGQGSNFTIFLTADADSRETKRILAQNIFITLSCIKHCVLRHHNRIQIVAQQISEG